MNAKKAATRVPMRHSLMRVEGNDTLYLGIMEIGGVKLTYRIVLLAHINWHNDDECRAIMRSLFGKPEEIEKVRGGLFQLILERDGKEVELTPQEYAFFASHAVPFIEAFMKRKETRFLDKAAVELSRRSGANPTTVGALVSKEFLSTVFLEERAMLQQPKFGCKF